MLKTPPHATPYIPNISLVLGALSVQGLQDAVGEAVWKYDADDKKDTETSMPPPHQIDNALKCSCKNSTQALNFPE